MKKTSAIRVLEQLKIPYETIDYKYDSNDLNVHKIAQENGLELSIIYKTLVVKGDKHGICVAIIPGHHQLSFKMLAKLSGNKKMSLLPTEQLERYSGYVRGGCSPLGLRKPLVCYLSDEARKHSLIYVNAGKKGSLIGIQPDDLQKASGAVIAAISQG